LDLISPQPPSQEKIRRKIFGGNPLVQADLRESGIFHKNRAPMEKRLWRPGHFAPTFTKRGIYKNG
jgi:hypothetical protein